MIQIVKEKQYIKIRAEEESIEYQGKMLSAIPWLLPFEWENGKELVYRKGEGESLTEWLRTEKREEEILDVLQELFENQKEIEAYLIDDEKLIVDPNWVFWNREKKILQFAYVPWDTLVGIQHSFIKRFAMLLWSSAVCQKWQNERLILMLYRMQITVKHQDQPEVWRQWIEQEKRKIKERDQIKERALDILMEDPEEVSKGWFRRFKAKFPFAIR